MTTFYPEFCSNIGYQVLMMRLVTLLVAIGIVPAATVHEQVWLRQVNRGPGLRNLDSSSLEFELKRSTGTTRLNLVENKRLNANAPVYDTIRESNGKQRLVRKTGVPAMKTRFFQDKANQGAFKMTLDKKTNRPVIRRNKSNVLKGASMRERVNIQSSSGDFYSDTEALSLSPAPQLTPSNVGGEGEGDVPYILHTHVYEKAHLSSTAYNTKKYADDFIVPDDNDKTVDDTKKSIDSLLKRIQDLLDKKQHSQAKKTRTRRSYPVYAVELIVVADPTIWNKFHQDATAQDSLTRDQVTELLIREHFVHIVQGTSLRFETIEDPAMNIYLTVSGFIIYTSFNNSNPLSPSRGAVKKVDAHEYLNSVRNWAADLSELDHDDHFLVFTDYELYSESPIKIAVTGMSFVRSICRYSRVSINRDGSYFSTVSVAAHELGHNLGSYHDGSSRYIHRLCPAKEKYIMSPSETSFSQDASYTPNPWQFSRCSVQAFKTYVSSLQGSANCLLDTNDDNEFNAHASQLPGMLHTADEQCQLERGEGSYLKTKPTNEEFCRRIACYNPKGLLTHFFTPAMGTDCGESGANKYCINGQCVYKSDEHIQGANDAVDNDVTDDKGCVDRGFQGFNCSKVADHLLAQSQLKPYQLCQFGKWEARCCAFCAGVSPPSAECANADVGWVEHGWNCTKLDNYLISQGHAPLTMCYKTGWYTNCCNFCADNGIVSAPPNK